MEQHFWIEALDDFDVTCEKYEILIAKIRLLGKPRYFQIDKSWLSFAIHVDSKLGG